MKLVYDEKLKTFALQTNAGRLSLKDTFAVMKKRDGRTLIQIEAQANMSGNLRTKSIGVATYLRAYMELGYEIQLVKVKK
jgi:hypothetical protein